ncbi:MAG TPA: DUF255 domain-containing protein [Kofleriaceae bacterium]
MKRLLLVLCALWAAPSRAAAPVHFETWSDAVFARAKAEHRYVLLDLGAVWCHWCHVMEDVTYQDPEVARLLGDRFIAVRADQDADPDLSRRYEDWGWPATIVFAPDGSEIVKRRGYLPPAQMAALLAAIIADPTPGPSVQPDRPWRASAQTVIAPAARAAIDQTFRELFDQRWAGWGTIHKYLDAEAIDYALATPRYRELAYRTLDAGLRLIDPVWGGMYQYSDEVDWKSPHYEKIMAVQTGAISLYLSARDHDPRYLAAARAIAGYLRDHLTGPDGALYTSQDADLDARTPGKAFYALDDAGRRKLGAPRVDTHVYPRENGWAIAAFAKLYAATHDADWLARARRAAEWIDGHRLLSDGAYRHGDADRAGPYLGDTLAMAEAQVALAEVDPTGPWLARAVRSAHALDQRFAARDAAAGYTTAPVARTAAGVFAAPARIVEDNLAVARLARRLRALTNDAAWRAMDQRAMRYLSSPTLVEVRPFSPGVLLLD